MSDNLNTPEVYTLSFGKIIKLKDDLAEVIVDEGVEMNLNMIAEYHGWLLANLRTPFMILINKIYRYTYTFEAQKLIGDLAEVKAMAVVSYTKSTDLATQSMMPLQRKHQWNLKIFTDKDAAITWLESQRAD